MTLPPLPESFHWTTETWGAALRCRALDDLADHLFTTRQLPLVSASDYEQLAGAVAAGEVMTLTQVHGASAVVIRNGEATPASRPEADVLVSDNPAVAIAVRAADCVPILIADRERRGVAAVHAGWRGTAARAAVAAVAAMQREFGTSPRDVVAAIGPAIGLCCYQVGPELVDAFAAAGHERYLIDRWFVSLPPPRGSFHAERPRPHLDLAAANRDQLVLAGVAERNIHVAGLCTAMHLDLLPSYRAEKERAGRIAGVIRAHA